MTTRAEELRSKLDMACALRALGHLAYDEMPAVAWEALEFGYDGSALRRLAAMNHPTFFEVGDLFDQAMAEMGQKPWSPEDALLLVVRPIAERILRGEIEPLEGVDQISNMVYTSQYFPTELDVFHYTYSDDCIPRILEGCRNLVQMKIAHETEPGRLGTL